MTCSKCRLYSRGLRRCLSGKSRPTTLRAAIQVVEFMGVSALCRHSPHRDKAIKTLFEGLTNKDFDVLDKELKD